MSKYDNWFENIKQSSGKYKQNFLEFTDNSLQQFLDLNPNHIKATQLLSDVLVAQKKIDEALELLEKLYSVQPDAACSRLIKVLLIIAKNCTDEDEQLVLYKRIFELDAEQLEAKNAWQKILHQTGTTNPQPTLSNPVTEPVIKYNNISNYEQPDIQLMELSQQALKILETENRETTQALFTKMTELESAYEKLDPSLNLQVSGSDILNVIKTMHQYAAELIQTRQQEKKLTQLINIEREARLQHEQELTTFTQQIKNNDKKLTVKKQAHKSQIAQLTSNIEIKEHSLQQVKAILTQREQDLKQAQQMEKSLMQHIRVQEDKLTQLNKQKEQLSTQLKEKTVGFNELVQNNDEQYQHSVEKITVLKKELDIQKYNLQQVKSILEQREQELAQYRDEKRILTQTVQQQTEGLTQLQQEKEQIEKQLVIKSTKFDEYIQTTDKEAEQWKFEITSFKQDIALKEQLVQKTENALAETKQSLAQSYQQEQDLTQQIELQANNLEQFDVKVEQLNQDIVDKEQVIQKIETTLIQTKQELSTTCSEVQNLTQQVQTQATNIQELNKQKEQLAQQLSEKIIAFKELVKYKQEGIEQYQQNISRLNLELDDKKIVLHNTETQLIQTKKTSKKTSFVNKILLMVSVMLGIVIWWLLQEQVSIVEEVSIPPVVSQPKMPKPDMQPIVIIPKQSPIVMNTEKKMPKKRNFCIYFKAKSWINIQDNEGKQLFEGYKKAGDYLYLQEPPSRLRVGNTSAVFIEQDCDMRQVTTYPKQEGSNHVFIVD